MFEDKFSIFFSNAAKAQFLCANEGLHFVLMEKRWRIEQMLYLRVYKAAPKGEGLVISLKQQKSIFVLQRGCS